MYFDLENIKKPPQKVAYLWKLGVFFLCSPNCLKQPRTSFPFYELFYPTISGRISDSGPSNVRHAMKTFCSTTYTYLVSFIIQLRTLYGNKSAPGICKCLRLLLIHLGYGNTGCGFFKWGVQN